mgnify:CR=1 FL=1
MGNHPDQLAVAPQAPQRFEGVFEGVLVQRPEAAGEDGDGAGYDILSFDSSGAERLVEVKTTRGSQTTPFFLTRNEYALAEERADAFKLMRLYSFAQDPRMFELTPPLGETVRLSTHTYEARFS